MAITKNFLKTKAVCKVKFCVSPEEAHGAEKLFLVGDFNKWDVASHPMKRRKDGGFSTEIEMPLGQDMRFRYRTGDGSWFNDPKADAYVPCAYACAENFLVKV